MWSYFADLSERRIKGARRFSLEDYQFELIKIGGGSPVLWPVQYQGVEYGDALWGLISIHLRNYNVVIETGRQISRDSEKKRLYQRFLGILPAFVATLKLKFYLTFKNLVGSANSLSRTYK